MNFGPLPSSNSDLELLQELYSGPNMLDHVTELQSTNLEVITGVSSRCGNWPK